MAIHCMYLLFFRNELPEYDDIELTRGIGLIDITDDSFQIPMKSWGMSVSATNINCVDSIFKSKYKLENDIDLFLI